MFDTVSFNTIPEGESYTRFLPRVWFVLFTQMILSRQDVNRLNIGSTNGFAPLTQVFIVKGYCLWNVTDCVKKFFEILSYLKDLETLDNNTDRYNQKLLNSRGELRLARYGSFDGSCWQSNPDQCETRSYRLFQHSCLSGVSSLLWDEQEQELWQSI